MELNDIIKLIRSGNVHAFYKSGEWLAARAEILKEQKNECQICKSKGGYSEANIVHHIKHLKEHPELALVKSNLMAVCGACHNELHPEKAFKDRTKKKPINEERW